MGARQTRLSSFIENSGIARSALVLSSVWIVAVAAGCQSTTMAPIETAQASAYADEAYPVRLVNRKRFSPAFRPTRVANTSGLAVGSILIDSTAKHLYFVESEDTAIRYGIAVGQAGYSWKGEATIGRMAKWPAWFPTDEMKQATPGIPSRIPPGADNPLGARALYLYQNGRDTLYRIHGTSEPWTIGTEASSGCIRMFNEDVIELFSKARTGATVVVR